MATNKSNKKVFWRQEIAESKALDNLLERIVSDNVEKAIDQFIKNAWAVFSIEDGGFVMHISADGFDEPKFTAKLNVNDIIDVNIESLRGYKNIVDKAGAEELAMKLEGLADYVRGKAS